MRDIDALVGLKEAASIIMRGNKSIDTRIGKKDETGLALLIDHYTATSALHAACVAALNVQGIELPSALVEQLSAAVNMAENPGQREELTPRTLTSALSGDEAMEYDYEIGAELDRCRNRERYSWPSPNT